MMYQNFDIARRVFEALILKMFNNVIKSSRDNFKNGSTFIKQSICAAIK